MGVGVGVGEGLGLGLGLWLGLAEPDLGREREAWADRGHVILEQVQRDEHEEHLGRVRVRVSVRVRVRVRARVRARVRGRERAGKSSWQQVVHRSRCEVSLRLVTRPE